MRYQLDQYDKHGFIRLPIWLWLSWFVLAKPWVVFVMAGASRQQGSEILSLLYPSSHFLYLSMLITSPVIALIWLVAWRTQERVVVAKIVGWGRSISLMVAITQLVMLIQQILNTHGAVSMLQGINCTLLLWVIIYLYKSKTVRDALKAEFVR